MTTHLQLGPGREFDIIRDLLHRWGSRASGIGDDAAVVDVPRGAKLVVSTDASVEGVHFRRDWLSADEIGYRATVAALSDIAAMAATPLGILVALTISERWRGDTGAIGEGIGRAVAEYGVPILGGNTSRGGGLSITLTVLGAAARPLGRDGARGGDGVYVTGRLGGPLQAVRAFQQGAAPTREARSRFAHPVPRIREALWLAARGAHAAIDISDGLAADLRHLAAASRVRLVIDVEKVPRFFGASTRDALSSGEEYELVVTAPAPIDCKAFETTFGEPLTRIGEVERTEGDKWELAAREGGRFVDLPSGYDHFST